MKVYEVTKEQYNAIVRELHGYVFRRIDNGKYFLKLSDRQAKHFGLLEQ